MEIGARFLLCSPLSPGQLPPLSPRLSPCPHLLRTRPLRNKKAEMKCRSSRQTWRGLLPPPGGLSHELELQFWENPETCSQGFLCGPAGPPLGTAPRPHPGRKRDEVICGVFHADRMQAGPQTEGRKLKGSLICMKPWPPNIAAQHIPTPVHRGSRVVKAIGVPSDVTIQIPAVLLSGHVALAVPWPL